jgi:hypothetical protein
MCWRHLLLTENIARATASSSKADTFFHTLRRSRTFVDDLANFFWCVGVLSAAENLSKLVMAASASRDHM